MDQSFNLNQKLSQKQTLGQKQVLGQKQFHSLNILELPLIELDTQLQKELQENPLLVDGNIDPQDMASDPSDRGETPDVTDSFREERPTVEVLDPNRSDFEEGLEEMLDGGAGWDSFVSGENDSSASHDTDESRQFAFDSLSSAPSLQEQLLEQLHLSDCPDKLIPAAEEIIGNLDDAGYLQSPLNEIAAVTGITESEAEQALNLVQSFEPAGIGARDLAECLLLQLKRQDNHDPELKELIQKYLPDLGRNRRPQIAEAMNISVEQVNELAKAVSRLNPHPASGYVPEHTIDAIPEVIVRRNADGEFEAVSNKERIPRIGLSRRYLRMLDDPLVSDEAKAWIREKILGGKQLIEALQQRESTILRIAKQIVTCQYDFFEQGKEALKPMTMKDIAARIGRDESTVSRTVSGKYMDTPQGLIAFKDMFSSGYQSADGEDVSSAAIKELIRQAVEDEDRTKPLSDSKLESMLKEEGFNVARRTVAKYREELGILSSQGRKVFS